MFSRRKFDNIEARISNLEYAIDSLSKYVKSIDRRISNDTISNVYTGTPHETIRGEVNAIKEHLGIRTTVTQTTAPRVVAKTTEDDVRERVESQELHRQRIESLNAMENKLRKQYRKGKK